MRKKIKDQVKLILRQVETQKRDDEEIPREFNMRYSTSQKVAESEYMRELEEEDTVYNVNKTNMH